MPNHFVTYLQSEVRRLEEDNRLLKSRICTLVNDLKDARADFESVLKSPCPHCGEKI